MQTAVNPTAPKKAANLSINSELLNQAKALHINLSATLERALAEAIRDKQRHNGYRKIGNLSKTITNASKSKAVLVTACGVFNGAIYSLPQC
jgi:antitoxin CcdA